MNVTTLYRGRKTWWPSFTSWGPRILRVGCKLNRVEAKVDDYDELGDSMTRWKDVAWFQLSREGDEDGKDLESKIDDVMMTRNLQGGNGAACNVWLVGIGYSLKDENKAKTNKTEHGIGKSVKKSKSKAKSQSQKVKVKDEAESEEILNGTTRTYLMGRFPIFDDDDDEYTIQYKEYLENSSNAITPDLSTEDPDNSLSMGDEHLSTIPETESDELIKSSVENLVPILSESEGISNDTCDEPFCDNSPPLDVLNDHFEIFLDFNDDCTSSDDDSFENIDYIESLNDNLTPDCVLKSPSTFPIPVADTIIREEARVVAVPTHSDNFLPEYESFLFEIEPDQGELTSVVMEDILGEPRVRMLNVLPTHPTLMLNSNFIPSDDSLGSDLEVSFPSGTRNKIFDPEIFFEVQSKRFLTRDTFSISFIRNPLCPVIETLLPFSSEMKPKFSILGFFLLISYLIWEKSLLDFALDNEASRDHGFVLRSLELHP
ncbi:hypothetical protein Tco_0373572 [Tanacetum coccineum]